MATESGNFGFTLSTILLSLVLVAGCNTVMPVKPQAKWQTDSISTVENRQSPVIASTDDTLPNQEYNAAGEKVPYVPQPNPYTAEAGSIPSEANAIFLVANARLEQGDLKGATERFTQLTEKYPSLSGPWVKLGAISETQEIYPEAIKHYKQAISVNKNNVNAYMALGLVQRKQGDFSEAFTTYHDALTVWKDFPEAHLNLAILYDLYLNNPEEAQKHYEAYNFLTGEKNEKAKKWLVEIKHRTGIEQSFIDNPPPGVAEKAATETDGAIAVAVTNGKN